MGGGEFVVGRHTAAGNADEEDIMLDGNEATLFSDVGRKGGMHVASDSACAWKPECDIHNGATFRVAAMPAIGMLVCDPTSHTFAYSVDVFIGTSMASAFTVTCPAGGAHAYVDTDGALHINSATVTEVIRLVGSAGVRFGAHVGIEPLRSIVSQPVLPGRGASVAAATRSAVKYRPDHVCVGERECGFEGSGSFTLDVLYEPPVVSCDGVEHPFDYKVNVAVTGGSSADIVCGSANGGPSVAMEAASWMKVVAGGKVEISSAAVTSGVM